MRVIDTERVSEVISLLTEYRNGVVEKCCDIGAAVEAAVDNTRQDKNVLLISKDASESIKKIKSEIDAIDDVISDLKKEVEEATQMSGNS